MTTADMLRAEEWTKGWAEGWKKGREDALLQLLTIKFGTPSESVHRTVREATLTLPTLKVWNRRILTADTIDAVFA